MGGLWPERALQAQYEAEKNERAQRGHDIGLEMGERHAREGYDSAEFDRAAIEHGPHVGEAWVPGGRYRMMSPGLVREPRGFYHGYDKAYREHGGTEKTGSMDRIAVLVSDSPIKIVAHVSGNQIDILHCPFCGSGAVIGRSDGTIECGYCTSVFTVQTQPQYAGMPQSVNGQPYQWPGMPDPAGVAAPDMPAGTNLNPNTNGELGLPPGANGDFGSSDPADGGDFGDDEDEDEDDSDKPDFLKGKGDDDSKSDDKKDKKKGDNPFAKKKSYRTADGGELDEANYLAHLAIRFAKDPAKVASMVKAARRG